MRHGCLLVMGLAAALLPTNARAVGLADLPWTITGGTLTNSNGVLTGNNISVLFGLTTGTLTFTSNKAATGWNWGSGGTISITGAGNVTLFSGVFDSLSAVVTVPSILGLPGVNTLAGAFSGSITSYGAQALGLSGPANFAGSDFSDTFSSNVSAGKSFKGATNVAGLVDAPSISMPEEWGVSYSLLFSLFALGMGGLALRTGVLRSAKQVRSQASVETTS